MGGGELHGIREQVHQHPYDSIDIRLDLRQVVRNVPRERHGRVARDPFDALDGRPHELAHGRRTGGDRGLAGLDLRDVEDVVDDADEAFAVVQRDLHELPVIVVGHAALIVEHELERSADGRERR